VLLELRRVLTPDGLIFLNLGDGYSYQNDRANPTWDIKPKDLFGMPWEVAFAARNRGFWLRNAIVWEKPNAMPKSVEDFFTPTYEMVFMLAKNREYDFDFEAVMVPTVDGKKLRRRRDVWRIPNRNRKGNGVHTAVFPEELVEPCVKVSAKAGDTVLDCFAGSCTTAAVAAPLGCRTVSIDRNPEFLKLGKQRVREALGER
jgi:site-specific DNA-methyltransferase (adenine-specific)